MEKIIESRLIDAQGRLRSGHKKGKKMKEESMSFGKALDRLMEGKCKAITRKNSVSKVLIQRPDQKSKMTDSYLYVEEWTGVMEKRKPLVLSNDLLFATDWVCLEKIWHQV